MRTTIRYSFAAALAALAISAAAASATPPVSFNGADRNHDGRVSWSEYVHRYDKFDALDENGDGKVTENEHFLANGWDASSWDYIGSMDTNHDGVVTKMEYRNGLKALFNTLDLNGDGLLSDREVDAPASAE